MDNKYFIYCIFKQKHQGWKGSVSGSTPPPPRKSAGFCCVSPSSPSTRRLINSRSLFCSFSRLWTFLPFSVRAAIVFEQRQHSAHMPELALRGQRSKVLQERHSEAIQATSVSEKQARLYGFKPHLVSARAPLKTSMSRVIIYSLIIYLFILSRQPDWIWSG